MAKIQPDQIKLEFSRGGTLYKSDGLGAGSFIVWRAPFACTATKVSAYRADGTAATINAKKNSSDLLSANLSLTNSATWYSSSTLQNSSFAADDRLEIAIASVTGSTQIIIQIEFTRP